LQNKLSMMMRLIASIGSLKIK